MLWGPNQVSDWWAQQSSWPKTVKNALFFNVSGHEFVRSAVDSACPSLRLSRYSCGFITVSCAESLTPANRSRTRRRSATWPRPTRCHTG